jgi:hypothetical protein
MVNIFLKLTTILVIVLSFSGCRKQEINSAKNITGQWRWLKTYAVAPLSDTNPLTPQNTGIQEILVFKADHTWDKTVNGFKTDSGIYSLGHGTYAPYQGAQVNVYDSIAYYSFNRGKLETGDYYEIRNDTLQFCPCYGGRFKSYTLPHNGSKFWIKNVLAFSP